MEQIEGFSAITVEYGKSGKAVDNNHADKVRKFVNDANLDDLIVISHGWNNSANEAKSMYKDVLAQVKSQLPKEPKLNGRKIGVLAVIWPSKRFKAFEKDDGAGQAGGAASAEPIIADPMVDLSALLDELRDEISQSQRDGLSQTTRAAVEDQEHWPAFLESLRETLPNDPEGQDEADAFLFQTIENPQQALEQFDGIEVENDDGEFTGGAAGGALSGASGAVGSILNYTTFYLMKKRAGLVGQNGLAHSVVGVRQVRPELRVHFVGHSFGARLVSMAALASNGHPLSAPDSMTLLQAAFSHNSFSAKFPPPQKPGFFRNVMAKPCVLGPILVSHTFNDTPVRVAYSIASALSGDNAAFAAKKPSQFGGLGANGAQHMGTEADQGELLNAGASAYRFGSGKIYNLKSDQFVKGHSDIKGPQVAYAIVKAMGATL